MLEWSRSKTRLLTLGFGALLLLMAFAPVYAVAPLIYADPDNISVDGTTIIRLETRTDEGPADFLYYIVHQVKVVCPGGDEYMLGNSTRPLSKWVQPPNGLGINVTLSDSKGIPFGTGVSMPITIDGKDYYWWRTKKAGSPVYPNERVDLVPTPNPTGTSGQYVADVEGWSVYGQSTEEIRLVAWFDIPAQFEVPELGLPLFATVALGFALLSFKFRKNERFRRA